MKLGAFGTGLGGRGWKGRRHIVLFILLIMCSYGALMPAPAAAGTHPLPTTGRLHTLTLYSPALHGFTRVNVLLPIGYEQSRRRYPVLYLLHGFTNSYASWAAKTDLVHFARPFAIIIVMPDGGNGWYINDADGGPRWEDYHMYQLIPFIDSHYRTIANRADRAIAGLSMGGFGALSYAARHPDLFSAAASFSGALDVEHLPALGFGIAAAFGVQNTWLRIENSPAELAPNLKTLQLLYMATGTGNAGFLDRGKESQGTGAVEAALYPGFLRTVAAFRAAGIRPIAQVFSPGTHSWPYWQRDLHQALPLIAAVFRRHVPAPLTWTYKTGATVSGVWGYHFIIARKAGTNGFVTISGVTTHGFMVTGVGRLTVTTAAVYQPGRVYQLRWDRRVLGRVTATRVGGLTFSLPAANAGITDVLSIQMIAFGSKGTG